MTTPQTMTDAEIIAAEIRAAQVPMSDALARALDRLERDAERYRWMREHGDYFPGDISEDVSSAFAVYFWNGERTIDRAIDAAMQGEA